jgi:hypothetical protein
MASNNAKTDKESHQKLTLLALSDEDFHRIFCVIYVICGHCFVFFTRFVGVSAKPRQNRAIAP